MLLTSPSANPAARTFPGSMCSTSSSRWEYWWRKRSHRKRQRIAYAVKVLTRGSRNSTMSLRSLSASNVVGSDLAPWIRASSWPKHPCMTVCASFSLEKSIFWLRKGNTTSSYPIQQNVRSISLFLSWPRLWLTSLSWCASIAFAHASQYPRKFERSSVGGRSSIVIILS